MNNQYYDYYQPSNKLGRPHYSPTPDSGYRYFFIYDVISVIITQI